MKKISISRLKPSQFAYGFLEIEKLLKKCRELSHKDLKKEIESTPITVVIAPNGDPFIVDGHHHAYIFWCLGVRKVFVKVEKDFSGSHLSYRAFWHQMKIHRWTHLFDQFGTGPRDPVYLPQNIQGLADDPYRSLAWMVKRTHGFNKSSDHFADFAWANFFRKRKLLHGRFERKFSAALRRALDCCQLGAASKLPGFKHKK